MSSRFKIDCYSGNLEFVNTGGAAYLTMAGQTQGGQRRNVYVELSRENVREIHNIALAFLNDIGPRPETDDVFGPERPHLSSVDDVHP